MTLTSWRFLLMDGEASFIWGWKVQVSMARRWIMRGRQEKRCLSFGMARKGRQRCRGIIGYEYELDLNNLEARASIGCNGRKQNYYNYSAVRNYLQTTYTNTASDSYEKL